MSGSWGQKLQSFRRIWDRSTSFSNESREQKTYQPASKSPKVLLLTIIEHNPEVFLRVLDG